MATPPTIVVVAHARPLALERLLAAIGAAEIADGTDLVLSVDRARGAARGQSDAVIALAEEAEWPHGRSEVLIHDAVGLVGHFTACGDLTRERGSIVLLEDDLIVGSGFQRWTMAALEHAETDERIAGVSLATPGRDGYRQLPFEPVDDGTDVLYAQVPWYDGMAFTPAMWHAWRTAEPDSETPLHEAFDLLGDDEWFPDLMRHLVANDRWWLLPRSAHATGSGAAGTHFEAATDWFQVPIAARAPSIFRFGSLDHSRATYDDHMEPTGAMLERLGVRGARDWIIDLGGTRRLDHLDADQLVLTTRPADSARSSWGVAMHPLAMNVVHGEPGDEIALAPVDSIDRSAAGDRRALEVLRRHHRLGVSRSEALGTLAPGVAEFVRRFRHGARNG